MTCDITSFLTVFQSHQGEWAGDNERLCTLCSGILFMTEKILPQAGLKPGTAGSEG